MIHSFLPNNVSLRARPFPRKGFALRTPLFFDVEAEGQAQLLGPLLHFVAEFRRGSKSRRPAEVNLPWTPPSEALPPEPDAIEE